MQPSGTILTGLRKYRNRSHAPIILDYSTVNDWFANGDRTLDFSNHEHFEVRHVTRAVMYQLAENKLSEHPRVPSIDDFAVWAHPKHGGIVCTESDYLFAKSVAAVTEHGRQTVRSIYSILSHHLKQVFATRGPVL